MKSNKGITLTSLIIYLIVLSITIGVIASITKYFKKNLDETTISANGQEQYTKLLTYLSEDLNSINVKNVSVEATNLLTITLKDNSYHQYSFTSNEIFFITSKDGSIDEKFSICKDVKTCTFTETVLQSNSDKKSIKLVIQIGETVYNNNYIVNNNTEEGEG